MHVLLTIPDPVKKLGWKANFALVDEMPLKTCKVWPLFNAWRPLKNCLQIKPGVWAAILTDQKMIILLDIKENF